MSVRNLDKLLAPRAVALIGASSLPGSMGATVLKRLDLAGFKGTIHLVNPKYQQIDGRHCVARLADIREPIDLGVIVTPPQTVPGLISELAEAGGRAAVVITAGIGEEDGLRQKMLDAARPTCLRILGPNCLGLQVPGIGLDASFSHLTARKGKLALLSQSGALVVALLDWAEARGIGFSVVASVGDMADVDVGDLLDQLAGDASTSAILMYLEQVSDARKFMSAARRAARGKPVIAVKAGRSQAAARAAASHTGALAGQDSVYDAALRRAGILRVEDLEELFNAAEVLARHKPLISDRLAILTNGGGAGVLAADALATTGARFAELTPETMQRLDGVLPSTWSHGNPVDIIGDAGPQRYEAALRILLEDRETDAVLVMNCPTGLASSADIADAVVEVQREAHKAGPHSKPILASWLGEATAEIGAAKLSEAGIPVYRTPAQAVNGFAYLARHVKVQKSLMRTPPSIPGDFKPDRETARAQMADALQSGRRWLSEPEAKCVLKAYGIETVETRIAASAEDAGEIAGEMLQHNAAVVLKILSPDITHKSDVGGVRLNIASAAEARAAAIAMTAQARAAVPEARIEGVVVQPMINRPGAHELILGLADDAVFGPVVVFGAGGTSVEAVHDKAVGLPPLDMTLAQDLIDETRISRLLNGYRNRPAADREAIALALVRLSQLAADMPEIRELDINPLLADENGVIALDARIAVSACDSVQPGGNPRFALRPYPSAWEKTLDVKGATVIVRPIRPEDEALYGTFIGKLTLQDIRLRFFGLTAKPTHDQIARFTQIDYARAMAFVAIDPQSGELMGVSRLAANPDYTDAEFAVIVRSDLKGHGIGWALMTTLMDYARSERIGALYGDVLRWNDGMLRLCRDLGFSESLSDEDPDVVHFRLETGSPDADRQ
ncbi:MAG: bifunctional acetate--CoA ligase family protein/GNAT family N-acetyltransferase [Alphaproteobacteria bacterium]|nr:bifunctional acetate--CoA ligase family protein/GNAT family N-acetyltransferase [Alphaproteobacteria bacterium]